ncbi:hypothetical protein, partial [Tahibacter aquaticus]|uniref:hypothetical protein n=1 Tax=Tahibacter aquaticus TaxID=520092 RepID=UPI001AAC920B
SNATQLTTYSYDNADRLEAVAEPGRTTTYTLDPVGNRTHERVVNAGNIAISDSTLVYNDRDQLTSRTDPLANVHLVQTWDDNGNLKTQTANNGTPRVYSYVSVRRRHILEPDHQSNACRSPSRSAKRASIEDRSLLAPSR